MDMDALLLNIKAVDFGSLVCQKDIQTEEEKSYYLKKGYQVSFTEAEFKEHFHLDPSCVWYTPSISQSCLYFNEETFAAAPFYPDLYLSSKPLDIDDFYGAIQKRENEVANHQYLGSLSSLPDGMRTKYFERLIAKKGTDIPNLYHLFFSVYTDSDYGFGDIDPSALNAIIGAKTAQDMALTKEKLASLPDVVKVYRGGNTASVPYEKAYSWTLDINIANFFACRRGSGEGYIVEGEVTKKDIIDAFLEDRNESEIIVDPHKIKVLSKTPIRGLEAIELILPEVTPLYHKYRDEMLNLDFAQDSSVHGTEHEARVLLLCLTIAHFLNLPSRDKKVLATAAIYHDTQRVNDKTDPTHGKASREYYHATAHSPDPLVEFICEYHCLPDETAYKEIMSNRRLSKNRSRSKLLFDVFKDADALDRVRFSIRDLDLNQLRLPVSKELSLIARLYLEQIKVPSISKHRKPSISDQIQSASARSGRSLKTLSTMDREPEPER